MLRYTSKTTNGILTQSIHEFCEACGVIEDEVHVSEVISKPVHLRDFTYKIKDAADSDYTLKLKKDRSKEIQVARMADGMITASGTTTESLKYGLRSERMCSSSNGTNTEFCFRMTDNTATASFKQSPRFKEFKEKYETKFRDKPEEEPAGYKIGMDRAGNPIRIKSESFASTNPNGESITDIKYYGAHKKEWYRELEEAAKLSTLTASLAKAESTKIEDYKYKESFDADTTSSYYTNDKSLIFDGTNDYIKLTGTGEEENGYHYTADQFDEHGVTISAWVYITASGSAGHPVLSIGRSNNKYYGYQMRISADFRIAMDYYGESPSGGFGQSANHRKTVIQSNSVAPTKLLENTWMQFTCVYGSSNTDDWRIYMNGKQMETKVSGNADVVLTYNGTDGNIGRLGKSNQGSETWFEGTINHVGLWKVALNDKSVMGLYNDGYPPYLHSGSAGYVETGSDQLRGYWELGEGEGTSIRGTGGHDCHGTLYNFAISEDAPQGDETSGWTDVSPLIEG